ncbi:DNA recombination protein RmuC [Plastorhodobacter daqingensis]|uniref:DNA recombination protein RmuC homolog n=1 Tax=Plastorhodobacter daqingensis TaxID=1387281 RepID=A0ABW2UIG8_9RHOB
MTSLADPATLAFVFGAAAAVLLILLLMQGRSLAQWRAACDIRGQRLQDSEARLSEQQARLVALETAAAEREARVTAEFARAERLQEARTALETALAEIRTERDGLVSHLRSAEGEAHDLRAELQSLRIAMQKDRAAAEREIVTLRELREEMSRQFRELAAETLRAQGEDFSRANQERLTALLAPFKDHVGRFQEELRTVHKSADEERARLKEQIAQLHRRSEEISQEAVNLTRALKGDVRRQGAWGEMILERILEDSGLEAGLHYETQTHRRDETGKAWRPDVVVKLPKSKTLVIDSKVSLVAYEAALSSDNEDERAVQMAEHVRSLVRHIDTLAAKGYHALDGSSVDYVLMFVPIEGALSEALRLRGDLTSYALQKGVGIMTPTTLMVALKTVEHIWAVERRESNAEEIADRAGKLFDKVHGFVTEMEKVGDCLRRAQEAHGTAFDRLSRGSGNVLGQVEKLRKLGARTSKTLPVPFDEDEDEPTLPAPDARGDALPRPV